MTEKEQQLHQKAYQAVHEKRKLVESDPYRQAFHLMPPSGLLNDPNGWIHWQGTYHLFFQWNPFQPDHTDKFWGHVSSEDLVHWREHPIALAPSEWYEKDGCYSGSAVEKDGLLHLVYTGNVKDENNNRESYQCLAVSRDGVRVEKKGPLVDTLPEGYTAHFRDPKVWQENGRWYFVIGAQTEDLTGRVLLYQSDDFENWELTGPLAGSGINGLGSFGYMWECPDYFELDGTGVLIFSPQGLETRGAHWQNVYQAGYFLGAADLNAPSFSHGEFIELDEGFEFYAPQTTLDENGRRILIGWMGVPDSDEAYQPTVENHWIHCLTIPRELKREGDYLRQVPVKELEALRTGEALEMKADPSRTPEVAVTPASELKINVREAESFQLELRDEAVFSYSASDGLVTLSRPAFKDGKTEERHCYVENLEEVHLYMDHSSLEFFLNDGEKVMSARFFPKPENNVIRIRGDKGSMHWTSWELSEEE
ncbi:sucrose-6-phosphate hydrolase [Alkalicoccus urumqiensis]|uniref:Sucrose-6-phosphate hydrolase n=1 Tax=Alkalicoccus urumqiensis TaxID=1548213 RepID=A0A2P6MD22_ALKUR|nr:sucrose-6-phosphate hydrolase [Alkalicoccus urumqiensis]PRO64184.1 sucrose-6-phosphate hydrolase [Alkalicoccus urumqiensis]